MLIVWAGGGGEGPEDLKSEVLGSPFSSSAPLRPASQSLSKAEVLGDSGPPLPLPPPYKLAFSLQTPFSLKPLLIVAHHTEGPVT